MTVDGPLGRATQAGHYHGPVLLIATIAGVITGLCSVWLGWSWWVSVLILFGFTLTLGIAERIWAAKDDGA